MIGAYQCDSSKRRDQWWATKQEKTGTGRVLVLIGGFRYCRRFGARKRCLRTCESHCEMLADELGFLFVLVLELAKYAPAFVLLGFGGIGVFFIFEPEAEPIDITM